VNVAFVHRLEFRSDKPPTIKELRTMLEVALNKGFPDETQVYIRANDSQRDGYSFYACIGADALETRVAE
jgi:hypothetical protein